MTIILRAISTILAVIVYFIVLALVFGFIYDKMGFYGLPVNLAIVGCIIYAARRWLR